MKIVLHLGAHKTASTYLQRRMQTHEDVLAEHGVFYRGPPDLRVGFPKSVIGRLMQPNPLGMAARNAILEGRSVGAQRIVISEENLLGNLMNVPTGFYRRPGRILRPAVSELRGADVTVLLSVRAYSTFYPSLYGQMLRARVSTRFRDLKQKFLQQRRGWPAMVADLMAKMPKEASLRLWKYEDFGEIRRTLYAELAGEAAAQKIKSVQHHNLPGPSTRAIQEIDKKLVAGERLEPSEVEAIYRSFSKREGHAAFDPWEDQERTLLDERYKRDLEELYARWPGAFIQPEPTSSQV